MCFASPIEPTNTPRRSTRSGARSATLTVELKTALLLRDVVGLSYDEIAETVHSTLATVKWRIYKAREEVQRALSREGIVVTTARERAACALPSAGSHG